MQLIRVSPQLKQAVRHAKSNEISERSLMDLQDLLLSPDEAKAVTKVLERNTRVVGSVTPQIEGDWL